MKGRLLVTAALLAVGLTTVVAGSVRTTPAFASITYACTTPVDSGGCTPFVVPDNVSSVTIEVWGAAGGAGGGFGASCTPTSPAEPGGYVKATYAVSPGDTLYPYVGAAGANGACGDTGTGGAGGNGGNDDAAGGNGGAGFGAVDANNGGGGGGGGESDVRIAGTDLGTSLADRIVIGGGGGGTGGSGGAGGAGGANPGNHGTASGGETANPGGGATRAAVGTGGTGGTGTGGVGSAGTGANGGVGGDGNDALGAGGGGGGGGGVFGGGGGQAGSNTDGGAGGGGGSGFVEGPASLVQQTAGVDAGNSGDGKIVITYTEPPVTGSPALDITATSATLVGYDENNDTYHFEYGTDTSYGSTTPDATAAPGVTLKQTVTGLTPDTTYHFRIDSRDGGPSPYDTSFHTLLLPVTGGATSITPTAATVHATDPNAGESYHFEYGTTTSYGKSTPTATNGGGTPAADLSGLSSGTTYHFRIVSDAGAGSDATFTTLRFPATSPAITITSTTAVLQGIDNNTGTTYHFQYGKTAAYGQSTPTRTTPGNASFLSEKITGLTPGATYHFRIVDSAAGPGRDSSFTTTSGSGGGGGGGGGGGAPTRDLILGLRGPASGAVGSSLRYVATIGNTGTAPVTGAKLTLSFRGGAIKVVSAKGCKGKITLLTCALPKIAAGHAVRLKVVVRETKAATLSLKARVVTPFTDPTPKNDKASTHTAVK